MESTGNILGPRNKDLGSLNKTILGPRIPRSQQETESIADYLVDKFQSPAYRPLFLKAAWRLSDATIALLVEKSFKKKVGNPRAYFIKSVKARKEYRD